MSVMVIGARKGSLGEAICSALVDKGYPTVPAGISGEEVYLDVNQMSVEDIRNVFRVARVEHVICTVGMNETWLPILDMTRWYMEHLKTNCVGPMKAVEAFGEHVLLGSVIGLAFRHAVVISSNSARIPRTYSEAYCASKAALSMAVRCKARQLGRAESEVLVYGYEPGLLAGTPMTEDIRDNFSGSPLHRMPGVSALGISPDRVADMIVRNLQCGREINGCLIPVDAGEV